MPGWPQQTLAAKHEIHRAHQACPRPHVVPLERLVHVKDGKGNEHRQADDFLDDFQLRQGKRAVANAIGRHLQQVFEQGNAPAGQSRHIPCLVAGVFQVGIPGITRMIKNNLY